MRRIIVLILALSSFTLWAQTRNEISFFLGPSITQSGGISDLGDPTFNTSFQYNYFLNENHGFGLSFGNEYDYDGSSKFPGIKDGSIHTFDFHYAFRWFFNNKKMRFTFTPGIGIQTLYDQYRDFYWGYMYYDDLSTAWIADYKLMFDYVVSQWETDGTPRSFFVGVGVQQVFSFNDEYRGQDISGSRLSGLFRLGLGF